MGQLTPPVSYVITSLVGKTLEIPTQNLLVKQKMIELSETYLFTLGFTLPPIAGVESQSSRLQILRPEP